MLASSMRVVLLVLAAAAPASVAKPVHLASRDAVAPPITNPTAQTVWRVGETQTVTWDVAALNGAPPSNPQASIILGTLSADGNEHLQFETPLVSGFPILGGNVTLTVPPVPSGSNYIVCCKSPPVPALSSVRRAERARARASVRHLGRHQPRVRDRRHRRLVLLRRPALARTVVHCGLDHHHRHDPEPALVRPSLDLYRGPHEPGRRTPRQLADVRRRRRRRAPDDGRGVRAPGLGAVQCAWDRGRCEPERRRGARLVLVLVLVRRGAVDDERGDVWWAAQRPHTRAPVGCGLCPRVRACIRVRVRVATSSSSLCTPPPGPHLVYYFTPRIVRRVCYEQYEYASRLQCTIPHELFHPLIHVVVLFCTPPGLPKMHLAVVPFVARTARGNRN